jgi:uncharacterized sporulation protein YeaH/YhbH (DUF444 family)
MSMTAYIVDRRFSEKNKSAVNRARFIERFKSYIKKAVSDAILKRNLTEIEKGERIVIPAKDISQPIFKYGKGGKHETVFPHNKTFVKNDRIKRPLGEAEQGQGAGPSNSSETGTDDFGFEISREEFLNIFFDDLALPDLVKKRLSQTLIHTPVRAGFQKSGSPMLLSVKKSMQNAHARRIAFSLKAQRELNALQDALNQENSENNTAEYQQLVQRKILLEDKLKKVPFLDTADLRFHRVALQSKPNTQAVMFCLMDVSGSMDESRKELAKRFFILLYLFLSHTYQKIEVVFIRHHTSAKEVDEHEFFYSRETGGTMVSSALELMLDIINKRYSHDDWNIYGAQASDGDNWHSDSPFCADMLINKIMPQLQYYAYIEILGQSHQNLWENYLTVEKNCKNFALKSVDNPQEIYPVFRELFQRKTA